MAEAKTEDREQTKPFAAWLQEQRRGGLHGELSDLLAEVATAALEHQKPGQLSLTVKMKPNKDGVTLTVMDEVKAKVPEADRGAAIFFTDGNGNLTREDPRQMPMPLREVPGSGDDTPAREVGRASS